MSVVTSCPNKCKIDLRFYFFFRGRGGGLSFTQQLSMGLIAAWKSPKNARNPDFSKHLVSILWTFCYVPVSDVETFIVLVLVILKYPRWFCIDFDGCRVFFSWPCSCTSKFASIIHVEKVGAFSYPVVKSWFYVG